VASKSYYSRLSCALYCLYQPVVFLTIVTLALPSVFEQGGENEGNPALLQAPIPTLDALKACYVVATGS